MNLRIAVLAVAALFVQSAIAESPGPYDDFIKQVQEKLLRAGFDAGPVNGDFGSETQAALAQFQITQLLPASGSLDDQTLKALDVQRPTVE